MTSPPIPNPIPFHVLAKKNITCLVCQLSKWLTNGPDQVFREQEYLMVTQPRGSPAFLSTAVKEANTTGTA